MAIKIIVVALAFVAVTSAGYSQPILTKAVEEYDPHPQYTYSYGVNDAITGDSKSQVETRDGDVVHGEYSLNDADGYRRIVRYTADPINGFNAVVHREPLVKAVLAAPVAYSAPAVIKSASYAPVVVNHLPISYTRPVYSYYH